MSITIWIWIIPTSNKKLSDDKEGDWTKVVIF